MTLSFTRLFSILVFPVQLYVFNFGAWIAAGISVLGSLMGDDNADLAADASMREYDIADRQTKIAEEQWARFKEHFAPIEDEIAQIAMKGPEYTKALGEATADVEGSLDKAEQVRRRDIGRYGLDPNQGGYASLAREGEMDRAEMLVGERNQRRTQEEDKSWSRKFAAAQLGKGMASDSATILGNAGNIYGRAADRYGDWAQGANASRGKALQSAGYWAGKAFDEFDSDSFGSGTDEYGLDDSLFNEGNE